MRRPLMFPKPTRLELALERAERDVKRAMEKRDRIWWRRRIEVHTGKRRYS